MNCYIKGIAAFAVCLALIGCDKKASVTKETTVKGPGGTTQKTEETTVKQSGENPPPINGAQPVIPNDGK